MKNQFTFDLAGLDVSPAHPGLRSLSQADSGSLADLLLSAYRDTPDDEGEGPEEALEAAESFTSQADEAGLLGCCCVVEIGGELGAACLVAPWNDVVLISTIMTDAKHKKQGLGTTVLEASLEALRMRGHSRVIAFITAGNRASERLFIGMGFVEVRCPPGRVRP